MARGSNEIKPLFDERNKENEEKKTIKKDQQLEGKTSTVGQEKVTSGLGKYKKEPKYKTHVAHNIRIPKEMRSDLETIAKKLKIPLGKNTGFFQEFTIDALEVAIEQAKKELGIDDK